jgi:hypothetical protein
MLIKFFRSSFAAQYIALVIMAFLLWLPAFLNPVAFEANGSLSPLSQLISIVINPYPLVAVILAFSLLLTQALFFNAILAANGLISRVSSIGAFIYILLMSQVQQQTALYDYLLAAVFILAAMHTILLLYDSNDPNYYHYNTGLFTGVASLFYFPSILIILWLWICIIIYRTVVLRGWAITITGFITPYFFLASWYFLTDQLAIRFYEYLAVASKFHISYSELMPANWSSWLVVLLITLYSLPVVYGHQAEKTVSIRTKISLNTWLLIISIFSIFYSGGGLMLNALVIMPIAVIISYYLSFARRLFIPQLLLFVLMVLIILNQYVFPGP